MTPAPDRRLVISSLLISALKDEVTILRGSAESIGSGADVNLEMVAFLKYSAMRCGELLCELEDQLNEYT